MLLYVYDMLTAFSAKYRQLLGRRYPPGVPTVPGTIVGCMALSCLLGGNTLAIPAAQQMDTGIFRHFADWCANKANLNSEARHTVEVLL